MIKKILTAIIAATLCISILSLPAAAQLSVSGSITPEGVVVVSGFGNPGFVFAEIIRGDTGDGYEVRDMTNSLIMDGTHTDTQGSFSFTWTLPASEATKPKQDRSYTLIIGNTGDYTSAQTRSLPLYWATSAEIVGALANIGQAITASSTAELGNILEAEATTLQIAGIISDAAYTSNKTAVLNIVIAQGKAQTIQSLEQLESTLLQAIGVAALNGAVESTLNTVVLKYASALSLDVSAYSKNAALAVAMSKCAASVLAEYKLQLPEFAPAAFRSIEAVAAVNIASRGEVISVLTNYQDIFGKSTGTLSTSESTKVASAICVADSNNGYKAVADVKNAYDNALYKGGNGGGYSGGISAPGSIGSGTVVEVMVEKKEPAVAKSPFKDLESVLWAKEYIEGLAAAGIVSGKGDGVFDPLAFVTREEFIKMIVLALSVPTEVAKGDFSDVKEDEWYASYINTAVAAGLLKGYENGTIGIGAHITREEAATLVARAAAYANIEITPADELGFIDTSEISDFAVEPVKICKNANIIQGDEQNRFLPKNSLTRAQCAKLVFCLMELL